MKTEPAACRSGLETVVGETIAEALVEALVEVGVRMQESNCPDKACTAAGWLSSDQAGPGGAIRPGAWHRMRSDHET
jgi:hypothetical protein